MSSLLTPTAPKKSRPSPRSPGRRSRHRRFNQQLLALIGLGLAGTGGLTWAIDPYGIFGRPVALPVNRLQIEKFNHTKLFKAADLTRVRPMTLLLGSSRTDLGLDPQHPALGDRQPAYNLGLVGPNMYEVKRYFDRALLQQPDLKTVVLGVDLFMFNAYKLNEVDFTEARIKAAGMPLTDVLSATLSWGALQASYRTVRASLGDRAYYLYREDGMRYVYGDRPDEPVPDKFESMIVGFLENPQYYGRYRPALEQMEAFRELVATCRDRGIELHVFISPSHALQWEALHTAGLWGQWEAWKRDLASVTPVWDFSGYNAITTEPLREVMDHYWDSSHYRKAVGDRVLARLFEQPGATPDFGVRLDGADPAAIEAHLAQVRRDRQAWAAANPDQVTWVDGLANPTD